MKTREPRRKVVLRARMRVGASWADACIVNISSRGLGLQTASPPSRGTYVEIRKGHHVIVARVAWTNAHRFGVRAQDELQVESIISESAAPATAGAQCWPQAERRRAGRPAEARAEHSRLAGRALEFACVALAGGAAVLFLLGMVESSLGGAMASVRDGLDLGSATASQ